MARKDARNEPADEVVAGALDVLGNKELPDEIDDDVVDGQLLDAEDDGAPVPDDLTFTTREKDDTAPDAGDVLEIKLDGVSLWARKPSKGAWSLILGSVSRAANQADKTQAILEFVFASFDQSGQILLKNRMFDPEDKFDIDDLSDIVSKLIGKWAPQQSRRERRAALMSERRNGNHGPVRSR